MSTVKELAKLVCVVKRIHSLSQGYCCGDVLCLLLTSNKGYHALQFGVIP